MNVALAKILFNISNLLFIAGSASLINDFRKNPIKYKIWSAWLTLIAVMNIQIAYLCLEDFLSIALAIPTVAYWGIAAIYALYKSWEERKNRNIKRRVRRIAQKVLKWAIQVTENK